ncbi:hypothetical protein OVA14_04135 [Agrococcus sp. SL85]|uniref:hypothetical protein n=1 Tax=Agrococcus sp. SL85 TaxID=2995141 RepID=UPI00226CDF04|nr:hypothetical protein [Agrococcus sp. SL85]WAC66961.1 hypothetical protein OVA14_04135 [Agrococcus sp. SL85]
MGSNALVAALLLARGAPELWPIFTLTLAASVLALALGLATFRPSSELRMIRREIVREPLTPAQGRRVLVVSSLVGVGATILLGVVLGLSDSWQAGAAAAAAVLVLLGAFLVLLSVELRRERERGDAAREA